MTEESLFQEALSRPPEERAAFLDAACAGRPQLRASVAALLAAAEKSGNLLDRPPADLGPTADSDQPEAPGAADGAFSADPDAASFEAAPTPDPPPDLEPSDVIAGRYLLQQKIGEGGMGEVWVAKQTEPVKRKVALKLIKAGMDSRAVLQRFEQERQALALMDHPHIARVLDGGLTPDRRPFFVMELVNGLPLTRFCDEARLGIRERLELFAQVCQAVQHAHQKGIIHRDLKPSNILVTLIDGRPVPKVIDFGLAKATAGKLTDESLSTQFGAVVGTLEYMAPEQAGLAGADIDTRADIYALGVILYELLTGLRPLDAKRLKQAAYAEVLRILKEEEPSKPSTRLSTDESAPSLAALRLTEPRKLAALLRGELDWVVMKCLEKPRDRRYETANALSRDVQRYLANEVVEARPPSAGYRLRKFVRRNRGRVAAAGLVLLALLVGMAGTTWGLIRAAQANGELAKKNAALADEQAKVRDRFDMAMKAIALFHTGVSEDVLLKNAEFKELRTKLLKEAAGFYTELEKLLAGQTDATSRKTLAEGYFQLGELTNKIGDKKEALAVHRKALALRRELAAAEGASIETRLDVARSLNNVGFILGDTGDHAGALAALEEARDLAERLDAEHPNEAVRAVLAQSHQSIGGLLAATGKPGALAAYQEALALQQQLADANPAVTPFQRDLARSHQHIGTLLAQTGKPQAALAAYDKALRILQKLADANPAVTDFRIALAQIHNNIGGVLAQTGEPAAALKAHEEARAIRQKLVKADPAVTQFQGDLARSHQHIGTLLAQTGKPQAALAAYDKALRILQKLADANPTVTPFQSDLAVSHNSIGDLLGRRGLWDEAAASYRQARAIRQKLADAYPAATRFQGDLASSCSSLGILERRAGRPADAVSAFRQAVALLERLPTSTPYNHYSLACYYALLAGVAAEAGSGMTAAEGQAAADKAMAALRRAIAAGYRNVSHMRTDTDLDPLRARADFQELIAGLEKKSPGQPDKQP